MKLKELLWDRWRSDCRHLKAEWKLLQDKVCPWRRIETYRKSTKEIWIYFTRLGSMDNTTMFRWSVFYEMGMECDTDEERLELWQAIMEYGLFWKEPPKKLKPIFVNVRFILNRSKEISGKRSKAWKNHTWNQYTKGDAKREAQKNGVEQNGTNGTNQNSNSLSNSNSILSSKKKYLEYVYISDNEYKNLIDWYWERVIKWKIEDLNNYIWQKWKDKYSSHYHTILAWLRKDWVKKLPEKPKDDSWVYENLRDQDVYLQELIKWKQK